MPVSEGARQGVAASLGADVFLYDLRLVFQRQP
jgi:hypothetical protein